MFNNIRTKGRGIIVVLLVLFVGGNLDEIIISNYVAIHPNVINNQHAFIWSVFGLVAFTAWAIFLPFQNWIWANPIDVRAAKEIKELEELLKK